MAGNNKYQFGMIGLGVMGRNLLLNIADHGFYSAGYDKGADKVSALNDTGHDKVKGFNDINSFIEHLASPRALMMLVPAGKIVDDVIAEVTPLLSKGDILIDGGNSHYTDTERRSKELEAKGLHFFGMGISGGEEGARNGPSMMPGGDKAAYKHLQHIFDAIAAKVNGEPCVTYIGPGASGHFVKMVHNGIEYAQMQLLAETYEVFRKGLKLDNDRIHSILSQWNAGRLQSFLMEITSEIFAFKEKGSATHLLEEIKDEAKSKGTGKWTSQAAMDIMVPITSIDTAVAMRDLSKYKALRTKASAAYQEEIGSFTHDVDGYIKHMEQAFYFSMVITYAQGLHMLFKASEAFKYELKIAEIAKIWRGGCIIRSAFLEDLYTAFTSDPTLEHALLDKKIQGDMKQSLAGMRTVVADAAKHGLAIPAYAACLSYFDAFRSEKMPSNLIQAQRDFFGAHTYERIGREGVFHTEWSK